MALLKIYKDGQISHELSLQAGKEYTLGRSASCDVVLEGSRGISRQHIKILGNGSSWKVENLSQYGELYVQGSQVAEINLDVHSQFSIPPYEFVFEAEARQRDDSQSFQDSMSDRTQIGVLQATAYLIANRPDQPSQIFQLEGTSWIGGRDTSCALFLDDAKFSRQHFEISLQGGTYLVKDLESSNGTRLNGQPIPTDSWTQIVSGDVLTVVDWTLQFELRDSNFDHQVQQLSDEFRSPMVYQSQDRSPAQPLREQAAAYYGPPIGVVTAEADPKKTNFVRIAIGALVVMGALFYLFDDQKPAQVTENSRPAEKSALEKLKPEQQQYVKDTYRLADRLFKEGRYEMARQEVTKIHQLVPYYEESKNLEKLADVAIQTVIEQKRAEAREQEQADMEAKIQATVAQCEKLINRNVDSKKVEDCLSPIIVLNPEHPAITGLQARVDQVISDRMAEQERRAEYQSMVKRQSSLYASAEQLDKKGNSLEAIKAYSKVVSSRLPDPQGLKGKAQRQIASIQQKLATQQSRLESEADVAFKNGDLKNAILKIKKALAINPENEVLRGRMSSMLSELKKQMQTLYQEGVLEESVGEVETAKAKWKKIIESSLPEEDYYKKSRTKLKKYGIE